MIDLHTHSMFSDGTLTPAALVAQAGALGLRALALTDHDTCAGIPEFTAALRADDSGLIGFAGVEISAEVEQGTMHLLGYGIDPENSALNTDLERIRDGRAWRNQRILEALRKLDIPLNWEEVVRYAGDEVVARPHFAQALMARGIVRSKQEAFDRFLAKGQAAYVDRFRLTPEQGVARIRASGGVAVLAHPFSLELDFQALRERTRALMPHGLQGLEVYYSEHSPHQTARLGQLARNLGLLQTGGSDYHGELNPDVRLGVGFGGLRVPDGLLEPLQRALAVQQFSI